jgi:ABC-type sulfate transport system permease component
MSLVPAFLIQEYSMSPFQILLAGSSLIAVFLIVALPMGWLGSKLYSILERYANSGIILSISMTAYIAFTILLMMVVFGFMCSI